MPLEPIGYNQPPTSVFLQLQPKMPEPVPHAYLDAQLALATPPALNAMTAIT